jgi:hypothetical protein
VSPDDDRVSLGWPFLGATLGALVGTPGAEHRFVSIGADLVPVPRRPGCRTRDTCGSRWEINPEQGFEISVDRISGQYSIVAGRMGASPWRSGADIVRPCRQVALALKLDRFTAYRCLVQPQDELAIGVPVCDKLVLILAGRGCLCDVSRARLSRYTQDM